MKDVSASWVARRTGLSVSFVSRLLRGERKPSMNTTVTLSKALGMSTDDVIRWLGWGKNGKRRESAE